MTTDPYEDDYAYYEGKKKKRKSGNWGSTISTIVILVIIMILIFLVVNAQFRGAVENMFNPTPEKYREYPEWADYTVARTITLSPRNPSAPMSYDVDIPKPRDIPNGTDPWLQDVKTVTANPDSTSTKVDYENQFEWMFWSVDNVIGQRTITIQYSIRTESAIWTVDPSESGTVDDIPQWLRDKYGNKTKDEWKILPTHPLILEESARLTANKVTVYDKFISIFDWMNAGFEYETLRRGSPKYCNETIANRRGDCDDQSVLFIALARAAGLPAWLEFGSLYNQGQNSWGGHAWVRAYIPYYYGGGHVFNIDIVNDHFLFRDAFRFTEWEADGDGDHLQDYYYSYGSNFMYDESYQTISMRTSTDTVKIGEDGRPVDEIIPGFEAVVALPAMVLILFFMGRKKRKIK
jgi:hypothetical protein